MKQARIEEIARELERWFQVFEWEWAGTNAKNHIPNAREIARTIRQLVRDCKEGKWHETGRIRVQKFRGGDIDIALVPVSFPG